MKSPALAYRLTTVVYSVPGPPPLFIGQFWRI